MKYLFRITIDADAHPKKIMENFNIVASTRTLAEAEACRLSGADPSHEPHTSTRADQIHSVVD